MAYDQQETGFQKFLKSKAAPYVGMVLAFLLGFLCLYTGFLSILGICGPFIVGILMYAIPKVMGADWKKLLVFGIVFFITSTVVFAFAVTKPIVENDDIHRSGEFSDITVTPVGDPSDGIYMYSVTYGGTGDVTIEYGEVLQMHVQFVSVDDIETITLTDSGGGVYTGTNEKAFKDGKVYYYKVNDSNNMLYIGPVTMSDSELNMFCLSGCAYYIGVYIMIVFFLIVVFTAWMRGSLEKTRARLEAEGRLYPPGYGRCKNCGTLVLPGEVSCRKCGEYIDVPEEFKPKKVDYFVCSECGKEVPADAERCPVCGETFDEVELEVFDDSEAVPKEKFNCSECGAEVPGDARRCPSCGERFED